MINQHLSQLDDKLRHAVLGNARIRLVMRMSFADSELLARELFAVSGQRVKETRWETVRLSRNLFIPVPEPVYFSTSEEIRQNKESLHYLPDRMMWFHIQGQREPVLLRSVEMPRAQLAAARSRVGPFKKLVAAMQGQPTVEAPLQQAAGTNGRTFEWAGGPLLAEPVGTER